VRSFLFVATLLCSIKLFAQPNASEFESFLEKATQDFNVPGTYVMVVDNGKVVMRSGYGKKSKAQPEAPNEETLFAIASLSKAFSVAAIAVLVEEGKLAWDDPVKKHLPEFKLHDPYVTENITVEDLLCHRSGLITFDGDLLWYGTDYSREEVVKRIAERPLSCGFREQFGYQNIMFITAGQVVEAVSGMTWDEFVKVKFLEPLEMNRTTTDFERFSMDRNMAMPHIDGEEIFTMSYENSGATAALNSCASDMQKWTSFWLNNGIHNGDTLLSKRSIDRIMTIHTPLPTGNFDNTNGTNFKGYGLGWFLMDYQGDKIVHHGGGLPGYITKVALCPKDDVAVIVLTNDMSSLPTMTMYAALDWLKGRDYEKWSETFLAYKKAGEKRKSDRESARLNEKEEDPVVFESSEYVGQYEDEMFGLAEVFIDQGALNLRLLPSKELFSGRLTPWSKHAFRFDHNDPFLTYGVISFTVEKDEIKGFPIDLPNQDFHFDKLDFKVVAK